MSSLLRSNLVVAAGTALSRVTGLLRFMVLGWVLGQTPLSDTYLLANETPNIIYDLLLGGVLSATLVPLFSSFLLDDDEEATNVVITISATLMAALTVVAVAAAPLIIRLYTLNPDEGVDPDTLRSVGTTLARVFLLQILFYGLTGLANAFLNSRRRFFAAAWSPVVSNLVIIVSLLTLRDGTWELADVLTDGRLRWTLGLGATGGIAAMGVIAVGAAARTGFRFRPSWQWRHPAVRKLLALSGWTLGFVSANQVALLVIRNLTEPGSNATTAYVTAFTFFVLPHGLLAVSISTTFQPEMARAVTRRDRAAFVAQTSLGVRLIAMLTLPAGVGIFVLREPLIGALLEYRNFSAQAAENTADALAGFALGLVGFSVYMFLLRGFYAHQDTKTPFIVNVVENVLNVVVAILLVGRFGVFGLALSYAIAYAVSAVWTLRILARKVRQFPLRPIAMSVARSAAAAAVMGVAVWLITRDVVPDQGWRAAAQLVVGGIVGIVVYGAVLVAANAPEVDSLTIRLRRKRAATTG